VRGALEWLKARGISKLDVAIVLILAVLSQVEAWAAGGLRDERVPAAFAGFALALAFLLRRRAPLATVAVAAAYFALVFSIGWSGSDGFPGAAALVDSPDLALLPGAAVLLATYSVAAYSDVRAAVAGAVIVLAVVVELALAGAVPVEQLAVVAAANGIAWTVGRRVRRRRARTAELADRVSTLELEQEERARAAVAEERARIARELHDVVSHSITVIVWQAAAERRVAPLRESTRHALETIEETGRQALAEMRRLLRVLRSEEEPPELAPQPSLRHLEQLVEQVREAGMPVELRLRGAPTPLPAGVDLSAYRIVQEALTNALKHAGRTSARVTIRYRDSDLELEVADDGRGDGDGGAGHGLIGMRERADLFGGAIDAGPRPEGGYAVRARFPLEREGA
jgi:signal transduction histidine kinase